jgi:chemotaxis protein methyltransferase CheR
MAFGSGDLLALQRLLRAKAGIVLTEEDRPRIEARLAPVAKANGLASVEGLLSRMRTSSWSALHQEVIEALLVHTAPFIIDHHLGRALIQRILPQLISARAQERRLRFWCPLCSTGQGPASLAVLLLEHFPELTGWDLTILASHRLSEQLDYALAGSYSPVEVVQGMPTQVLLRRFRHQDGRWKLKEESAKLIRYRDIELRGSWPELEPMDLIVIREVLAYLPRHERTTLVDRMRGVLAHDGYLLLDGADAAALGKEPLATMHDEQSGFYRAL